MFSFTLQEMADIPVDIDKPRWDQRSFYGRFQHFLRITNPLLSLKTEQELEKAADLVKVARYKKLDWDFSVSSFPDPQAWYQME